MSNDRKFLLVILLLTGLAFPAVAQEKDPLYRRVLEKIRTLDAGLDPAFIYQLDPHWSVALTGGVRQAGIRQDYSFLTNMSRMDDHGIIEERDSPSWMSSSLQGPVEGVAGLQVGYGNVGLSFSQRVSRNGEDRNRNFSFDYLSSGYAVQLQYFDFTQPMDFRLTISEPGEWDYYSDGGKTRNPGRMQTFIADMFYFFNNQRFSYPAVYKGTKIQRRSAGSWMFGTKVINSILENDPEEELSLWTGGLAKESTLQVSVGGGFSYNYVPFHRQPAGNGLKGLRNLTFNVTFLPMVTLFNQFTTTFRILLGGDFDTRVNTMYGNLLVNYVARTGVSYTWDRMQVNLSGSYDSYRYRGVNKIEGVVDDRVETTGRFERWNVSLRLCRMF